MNLTVVFRPNFKVLKLFGNIKYFLIKHFKVAVLKHRIRIEYFRVF